MLVTADPVKSSKKIKNAIVTFLIINFGLSGIIYVLLAAETLTVDYGIYALTWSLQ